MGCLSGGCICRFSVAGFLGILGQLMIFMRWGMRGSFVTSTWVLTVAYTTQQLNFLWPVAVQESCAKDKYAHWRLLSLVLEISACQWLVTNQARNVGCG